MSSELLATDLITMLFCLKSDLVYLVICLVQVIKTRNRIRTVKYELIDLKEFVSEDLFSRE